MMAGVRVCPRPAILALVAAFSGFAIADLLAYSGLIPGGTVTDAVWEFHAAHAWLPVAYIVICILLSIVGWFHFGLGRTPSRRE